MKAYIAGSFNSQHRLRSIKDELWRMGIQVVSTWLDEVAKPEGMPQAIFNRKIAFKDIVEINSSDVLFLDTLEASSTGGRETEFGFGIGNFQNKLIIRVGPAISVFHELVDLSFEDWVTCLVYMAHLQKNG